MLKKADNRANWIWFTLCAGLLFLSFIATIRSLFVGLDVDEQYALALSYRLAEGDLMLKEMWEPHQTSGILSALLVKLYLLIKGDSTYLLLYMRCMGVLVQGAIAFFWYRTMEKDFGTKISFFTAMILFLTVPKWIVMPEFANQQLWFWIVTLLCLYRYGKTEKWIYCVLAGISFCLCVLAYPSAILLVLPYMVWLGKRNGKGALIFIAVCAAIGSLFVGFLFAHMGIYGITKGIAYVLADPLHGEGASKMVRYGKEILELAVRIGVYALISFVIMFALHFFTQKPKNKVFAGSLLGIAMADQVRLWVFGLVPNVHPQIHYLLLYLIGLFVYLESEHRAEWKDLFGLGWISSLFGFLSVILLTNLDLKASFVHLLPGVLVALLFVYGQKEVALGETNEEPTAIRKNMWKWVLPVVWILLLFGSRTFLLRGNWGASENLFVAKQKILYGSAKYIYGNYMTGHEINSDYELVTKYIKPRDKVLYLGSGNLLLYVDLMTEVCSGSTISTVVFDKTSLEYYKENPDKMPDTVIVDKGYWEMPENVSTEVKKWVEEHFSVVENAENEFLRVLSRS